MDMLRNYTDFVYFRQQMIDMGQKVEATTAACMFEARKSAPVQEASDLASVLEEHEQRLLETETRAKCAEYADLLKPRAKPRSLASGLSVSMPSGIKAVGSKTNVAHLASPGNALGAMRSPRGPIVKPAFK
jgi:hypothetical protein